MYNNWNLRLKYMYFVSYKDIFNYEILHAAIFNKKKKVGNLYFYF